MDEIRSLPEDQVSLRKDLYEKMFGRWTEVSPYLKSSPRVLGEL